MKKPGRHYAKRNKTYIERQTPPISFIRRVLESQSHGDRTQRK
jgi:hypothetical protein